MNARGFTLIEVLLYVALSIIGVGAAYALLISNVQFHVGTVDRLGNEEAFIRIEKLIGRTLRQGIRVNAVSPTANINNVNADGWIRTGFNSITHITGNRPRAWAAFRREAGRLTSDIRRTGFFFVQPRRQGTRYFEGVLLVDTGGSTQVEPDYQDAYVGHLVSLQTANAVITGARVSSIDVIVTARFFPPNRPAGQRCFLPTGCPAGTTGRDETRRFTILIRNNPLVQSPFYPPSPLRWETPLGLLYFFQDYNRGDGVSQGEIL